MLLYKNLSAQAFAGLVLELARQTVELRAPSVTVPCRGKSPSISCVSSLRPRDLIARISGEGDPRSAGLRLGVRAEARGYLRRQIRRRQKAHEAVGHDVGCVVFGMSQQLLHELRDRFTDAPAAVFVVDAFAEAAAGVVTSVYAGKTVTPDRAYARLDGEIRLRITPEIAWGPDTR